MQKLELNLNDLPESVRKQVLSAVRRRALTAEQRRVVRAAEALRKAGVDVTIPDFPAPDVVVIRIK